MRSFLIRLFAYTLLGACPVVSFLGCSSSKGPLQQATAERDAEAKSFTPVRGRALIYIYREQGYMRNEVITVDVGNWIGGRTKGKTFLLARVAPGEYVVTARGDEREELPIEVNPGGIYFIKLRVRPAAVTANASLQLVDEQTGKSGVRQCRLIELDDEPNVEQSQQSKETNDDEQSPCRYAGGPPSSHNLRVRR